MDDQLISIIHEDGDHSIDISCERTSSREDSDEFKQANIVFSQGMGVFTVPNMTPKNLRKIARLFQSYANFLEGLR